MPFNVTRLTILAGCFRGFAYCSGRRLVYTEEGWRCRTGPFKAVDSWDYMNYPERLVQMFLILRRTAGMIVAVLRKAWKTPIGATFFVSWCFGWLRWLFRSKDFFHLFSIFFFSCLMTQLLPQHWGSSACAISDWQEERDVGQVLPIGRTELVLLASSCK